MTSSFTLHQTVVGESHASSDVQNIKLRDNLFRVPPSWLSWPHGRIQEHYVFASCAQMLFFSTARSPTQLRRLPYSLCSEQQKASTGGKLTLYY